MKRTLLVISVISVFAALCSAQDDAAYVTAMKTVNPAVRAANMAVMSKDNAAVKTEADKLLAAFTTVNAYWTAKKTDDAIKLSQTAMDAAKTLSTATDNADQMTAMRTLRGTCNACHMAHRAGAAPNFEIK